MNLPTPNRIHYPPSALNPRPNFSINLRTRRGEKREKATKRTYYSPDSHVVIHRSTGWPLPGFDRWQSGRDAFSSRRAMVVCGGWSFIVVYKGAFSLLF